MLIRLRSPPQVRLRSEKLLYRLLSQIETLDFQSTTSAARHQDFLALSLSDVCQFSQVLFFRFLVYHASK